MTINNNDNSYYIYILYKWNVSCKLLEFSLLLRLISQALVIYISVITLVVNHFLNTFFGKINYMTIKKMTINKKTLL